VVLTVAVPLAFVGVSASYLEDGSKLLAWMNPTKRPPVIDDWNGPRLARDRAHQGQ
jgi:hypothetical protein